MLTRKLTPVSLRPERKLDFHEQRFRAIGRCLAELP